MTGASLKGVPRPTIAQTERRRDLVRDMLREGYAHDQIAASLSIHITTVTTDRRARRRELTGVPPSVPQSRRLPDPAPRDWRTEPDPPPPPPAYLTSSPVARGKALLDAWTGANAKNRLAFALEAAKAAGDEVFARQVQSDLADLQEYVGQLCDIAGKPEALAAAKLPQARDDLQPGRVYHGGPGRPSATMPSPGTGVYPIGIFRHIWAAWYAGDDLTDPAVTAKIARWENTPLPRVHTAVIQFMRRMG